ncbi:hypothetical protein BU25DRAFT_460933 [Macroventuria anomochaeta]|uniref:Uncharacterized protein n=1 Tax=Macroventuria anomochaeta TaxID=301207 RepID=A0ACB6RS19_9PLEO|nr:uncharacterized protein BU25DRAFT_460933 [Macroventuria anomochaeta]KAF2624765.1 hypothetical protein BU25DRAFT_460933 [Macroventuria anomochaeta]
MGYSPNPAHEIGGGMSKFVSGASDIDIPNTLMLAFLILFIAYNAAVCFDLDLEATVNFGVTIYNSSVNWVKSTRQDILKAQKFDVLPQRIVRMLFKPVTRSAQTVTVDAVTVPGVGTIALIRGLPSDLPTTDKCRFLETALYIQYQPQLQAHRTSNHTSSATTQDAQTDTCDPDLWNGTFVRNAASNASTPSTSGINTPTSDTFASNAATTSSSPRPIFRSVTRDEHLATLAHDPGAVEQDQTTHNEAGEGDGNDGVGADD